MVNPFTVFPRSHRDKPQKSCQPVASFFPVMAYHCSYIFCPQRWLCFWETEEIFLSGILLCVAVPFLLILRLLCLSPHLPELLKERNHHPCGVGLVGVEVRVRTVIGSVHIMSGILFHTAFRGTGREGCSHSYQGYKIQIACTTRTAWAGLSHSVTVPVLIRKVRSFLYCT